MAKWISGISAEEEKRECPYPPKLKYAGIHAVRKPIRSNSASFDLRIDGYVPVGSPGRFAWPDLNDIPDYLAIMM